MKHDEWKARSSNLRKLMVDRFDSELRKTYIDVPDEAYVPCTMSDAYWLAPRLEFDEFAEIMKYSVAFMKEVQKIFTE